MSNFNNIPTGLLVPAQVPLDAKRVVLNNAILQNLGPGNNLAFTYEDGLVVFSVATRESWEWRPVRPVEPGFALLPTAFVYPNNYSVAGINYSLKAYNFFRKTESLPLANLGTGKKVYKGINVVNERHEFYTLETDGKLTLSYPQSGGVETGVLLFTFPGFRNLSQVGTPIYKGYDAGANEFQFYTIDSEDIKIEVNQTTGVISLSLPESSSVPSIYVNQDYVPTYDDWLKANRAANGGTPVAGYQYKGEGTLAKPFTNTVSYTLNSPTPLPVTTTIKTSIQNGIDYYVGPSPTYDRLNPQRWGQKIQILSAINAYEYDGDFSYTNINVEIYGYVISNTTGKLIDMDNPNHFVNPATPTFFSNAKIYVEEDAQLEIKGLGFWNSGYDIPVANYTFGKILYLYGKGRIVSIQDDITKYIINSGINPPAPIPPTVTYNNAGFLTFEVTCQVASGGANGGQGIVQNGGLSKVEFREGAVISSGSLVTPTNVNLEAIKITGGWIRIFDSIISLQGTNNGAIDRERGFVLNKSGNIDSIQGPQVYMVNSSLRGHAKRWFDRKGNCGIVIASNCSTIYFSGGDLVTSTGNSNNWAGGTEGYVSLKNNTFDNVAIDTEKIDLTVNGSQSVFNIIGTDIIQSLKVFSSIQDAKTSPYNLPVGATFIKRTYINDQSILAQFKIGDNFRIASQSSPITNFIPMHSSAAPITNAVGDQISYNGNFATVPAFNFGSGAVLHYDEICVMT
jgi:hypothetical protein